VKKSSVARPHLKLAASLKEAALGAARDSKNNSVARPEYDIKTRSLFESRESDDNEVKVLRSNQIGTTTTTTTTTATTTATTAEEKSFARWILNSKDAATGYEDETFGLWIPISSPRKMTEHKQENNASDSVSTRQPSQQHQEEESMHDAVQRSGSYGGMSMDMDMDMDEELPSAPSLESSMQTEQGAIAELPELEDMKVLPEVVNFCKLSKTIVVPSLCFCLFY